MIALLTRTAVIALGIALGGTAYAQTSSPKPGGSAAKETLNQEDQRFVKEAGAGGLAEVELSKMAQKSENPEVKSFADRMVQDHTTANQELMTIATGLGIEVPKALDAEHQRMAQRLAGLHGKALDEQYMRDMVEDHNKTVTLFQTEERSGQSTELKQFAQKTLPIIQTHQKMAQELSRKVAQASAR